MIDVFASDELVFDKYGRRNGAVIQDVERKPDQILLYSRSPLIYRSFGRLSTRVQGRE